MQDYEEEETEEYETLGEIYDHEELAFADESEENHGERQKRGLGWLKNKKHPVKTCVTQKKVLFSVKLPTFLVYSPNHLG